MYSEVATKLAKEKGLPVDYVQSMLDWKADHDQHLKDIAEDAAYLGLSPEEYQLQLDQDESTRSFLALKGFTDLKSELGISRARKWLKNAAPDDLFVTEGTSCADGNSFDQIMAEVRRSMMLESLDRIANEPDFICRTKKRPTEEEIENLFPELKEKSF